MAELPEIPESLAKCVVCLVSSSHWCSGCKAVPYCSPDHQRFDWKRHSVECRGRTDRIRCSQYWLSIPNFIGKLELYAVLKYETGDARVSTIVSAEYDVTRYTLSGVVLRGDIFPPNLPANFISVPPTLVRHVIERTLNIVAPSMIRDLRFCDRAVMLVMQHLRDLESSPGEWEDWCESISPKLGVSLDELEKRGLQLVSTIRCPPPLDHPHAKTRECMQERLNTWSMKKIIEKMNLQPSRFGIGKIMEELAGYRPLVNRFVEVCRLTSLLSFVAGDMEFATIFREAQLESDMDFEKCCLAVGLCRTAYGVFGENGV